MSHLCFYLLLAKLLVLFNLNGGEPKFTVVRIKTGNYIFKKVQFIPEWDIFHLCKIIFLY